MELWGVCRKQALSACISGEKGRNYISEKTEYSLSRAGVEIDVFALRSASLLCDQHYSYRSINLFMSYTVTLVHLNTIQLICQ
jgi:hypothetical protein